LAHSKTAAKLGLKLIGNRFDEKLTIARPLFTLLLLFKYHPAYMPVHQDTLGVYGTNSPLSNDAMNLLYQVLFRCMLSDRIRSGKFDELNDVRESVVHICLDAKSLYFGQSRDC
jgi:hypothetical protein